MSSFTLARNDGDSWQVDRQISNLGDSCKQSLIESHTSSWCSLVDHASSWCALLRIINNTQCAYRGTVGYSQYLHTHVRTYRCGYIRVYVCVRTVCMYRYQQYSLSSTDASTDLQCHLVHTRSYEYGNLFLTATVYCAYEWWVLSRGGSQLPSEGRMPPSLFPPPPPNETLAMPITLVVKHDSTRTFSYSQHMRTQCVPCPLWNWEQDQVSLRNKLNWHQFKRTFKRTISRYRNY